MSRALCGRLRTLFIALAFVVLPSVSMPRTGGHIEYEPRHGAASAIGKMIEFKLERSGNVRCWVLDASGQREGKRISFFMKVNKGDAEAQVEQHFISLCAKGVFEAAPQPGPPPPRSPGEEPHSSSSARVDPDGAEAMDDGDPCSMRVDWPCRSRHRHASQLYMTSVTDAAVRTPSSKPTPATVAVLNDHARWRMAWCLRCVELT